MQVGFIGLGKMGALMASSVQQAGHELIVNDIRREAAETHVAAGAVWADTPAAVAAKSEIVFSSLPGPPEVEAMVFGVGGLLQGIKEGGAFFDMSTNSPAMIQRIHAALAEKGAHTLDCPVSGGMRGAAARNLAIWVGGDEAVFGRYRAVIEAIGNQVRYIGPVGSASVAKLVHNCTSYAIYNVVAEIFTAGVKAGVDPQTLWQAVRDGGLGRANVFDRMARNFFAGKYDPPAFALRLAHKDVALMTELGRQVGVPMRMADLTEAEMTEAMARGWGDRDSRVFMLLQTERANADVTIDPELLKQLAPKGASS